VEDVSEIINGLNDAQRQAVTAADGALLVLAGAGSGKTRVLVHRIAWVINVHGYSPFSVLAVTFTNKAAHEMKSRVEGILMQPAGSLWIGTFHNIAHRLLRYHHREAKLPDSFQIIDSDDQNRMLKRLIKELNIDEEKFPAKQAMWFINKQKDDGLRAHQIKHNNDYYLKVMQQIYIAYESACQQGGLVDFAELLLRSYELIRDNEMIRRHYQERFRHVLVDEFQDTNNIQYAMIKLLVGERNFLTIVGDDDQSIYGWRGAQVENIRQFHKDYPNVETIRLEQNYRSTGTILNAANAVIANNHDRLGKQLWTQDNQGEMISLYSAFNEQEEARFVSARIQDWVNQGNAYQDAAILYRSNAQSRVLEEALLQKRIPYCIYGGLRFFDRAEIKDALAYLRLVNNRDDDSAFERVVNTPTRGIGDKTVQVVRQLARTHGISMWAATEQAISAGELTARASNNLAHFLKLIAHMEEGHQGDNLSALTQNILEVSGLLSMYERQKGEQALAKKENLQELVVATREFSDEDFPDMKPIEAFLGHAALESGEQQADKFADAVQLMTIHSAKGLEFPLVFMVGMEEKLFPHQMSLDSLDGLEEERRLCYVGITRAMKKLYLSYAEKRRLYGTDSYPIQSRFIKEIPVDCIEEVRLNTQVSRPTFYSAKKPESQTAGGFGLGARVKHPRFGEGVVLNIEGSGESARIQINFESAGCKWLVLGFAKLEAV
jgi:DNA helicase II / ATP-dependent DNA helicase PcrA